MKKRLLCLFMLLCLLPAGALAEGPLAIAADDLGTESGFVCFAGYAWGTTLEEIAPTLTDAEKFDPQSDAYEWNRMRENPMSKEATVTPVETYKFDCADAELTLQLEFDGEHELYAYWLAGETIPAAEATQEDFDRALAWVQGLHGALSQGREVLFISAPDDLAQADRAYLAENELRIFYLGGDGTFCQLNCSAKNGNLLYNIGVGLIEEMPAIGRIIEKAKAE